MVNICNTWLAYWNDHSTQIVYLYDSLKSINLLGFLAETIFFWEVRTEFVYIRRNSDLTGLGACPFNAW
jgi:hypothetical protein